MKVDNRPEQGKAAARLLRVPGPLAAALLIVAAVALAYLPSLSASFQFDDWNVIVNQPRVHSLSAWWASMPGIRPLTKFTYALNYELGGGVAGFRAFNVLVHFLCALLVYCLIRAIALRLHWNAGETGWAPLWVALVFAVHPVQTEAVTYISGRSSSVAALCVLASIVMWLKGSGSIAGRTQWWLWSLILFGLALMAKETALVLPLALTVLVVTRDQWRSTWPYWLLAGAAIAIILLWPAYRHLIETSLGIRSIRENLLTQANASDFLLHELWALDNINADPRLPIVPKATAPVLLRAMLVVGAVVGGLALWRRQRAWAIGILWPLIWLAPTNSLLARFEVANDRQWYLALLGPAWLLACAGHSLASRAGKPVRIALLVVAVIIVAVLTTATNARNRVYATEISYWSDIVRKTPGNARAANNLGYALALQCRVAEAQVQFQRALQLEPGYALAGVNLRLLQAGALVPASQQICQH
ncbi:MAG: hypothetical protein ABI616_08115 [Pseudomonadota bacterium]